MKRRIRRIAPLQAGKIMGALYACLGLLIVPFVALGGLAGMFAQAHQSSGAASAPAAAMSIIMIVLGICAPIFYGLMGFIGGIIMAALYNLFAGWIGGIEVEIE